MDEINDLIMSSDAEPPMACKPPPRVAARLNRATKKKSASSSRRNSISSLHSNRSSRSGTGIAHSTHIAQHLRKNSIIESRRAKIADRNAHAELVRMRAQQAKTAPRTNRPSGEERALAAQQARERHLAQVAANCAEEVKRAKKVAEETREKKAAEQLRATEEIEKRHADAEKRRLQYQLNIRRGRTQGVFAAEGKKITITRWTARNPEAAAQVIQTVWRNCQRRKVMSEFLELNLDLGHSQTTSFEAMSDLLAQRRVLARTSKVLKLCGLLDSEDEDSGKSVAVRTFLAAFLILSHPNQVLGQSGEQEEDLMGKAKLLLMQFQRILSKRAIARTFRSTSEPIISLSEAYSSFQTAFTAWKNRDSSVLIETMVAQFVELDAIWQSVKNNSPENVAEDYKQGIRGNQTTLLVRLKRLAGPERALELVAIALKLRRKQSKGKKKLGQVKPRASAGISLQSSVSAPTAAASGAAAQIPQDRSIPMSELNRVISPMPDNRIVVHELAINKNYRIEVDGLSEERQATNRAVFNLMRADVEAGMGGQWILSMVEIIRERLLRLLTPGNSLHILISESLDVKMIESQLKVGAFSYEKFFQFMNGLLPKLCAPVRDAQVKALAADKSSDFIERLAKLMHIIDLLGLDHANYLLQTAGPDLIRRASQYEQQCFQESLSSGSLQRTSRWWRLARARASADLSRRSPDGTPPQIFNSSRIYMTGLVDLFVAVQPLQQPDVPETLELDRTRIEIARADILKIITIACILITAKNHLKRDVRSQWRSQSQRMWDLPSTTAYTDSSPYIAIIESAHTLPPAIKTTLGSTIDRVLAEARSGPNITHPVTKVLLQKIRSHAAARLGANNNQERVHSASTASEVLSAGGMPEFVGRIGTIVEEMGRVRQVDLEAHGEWIDDVAGRVVAEA